MAAGAFDHFAARSSGTVMLFSRQMAKMLLVSGEIAPKEVFVLQVYFVQTLQ
jgi:hypothetical protein